MVSTAAAEYVIKEMTFDADRSFNREYGAQQPIDLQLMTGEVNFYESLNKSYVTAKLIIVDDLALFTEIMELQGTETVTISIGGAEEGHRNDFTMKMKVVSIVKQEKVNDRSSVFIINCISNHAYTDAAVSISRSYTGQLEDISEKILKSYLNVDVKYDDRYWPNDEESIQGRVKLIVPGISCLETVEWLMERASGDGGSPYFAWQTIWDQNRNGDDRMRFGTYKTMLYQGILNASKDPDMSFFYGTGQTYKSKPTAKEMRSTIRSFEHNNVENTLNMINQGTVGSSIANLDTYTTQKMDRHFSLDDYIKQLKSLLGRKDLLRTVFDPEATLTIRNEKKITSDFDGRGVDMVTSYGTYEWENSYHDVVDQTQLLNKIRKGAVMSMLYKNVIDVNLAGYTFLEKEVTVGDVIRLVFDTQQTDDEGAGNSNYDDRTSGFYLILNLRHIFKGTNHRVIVSGAKIADNIL